MLDWLRSNSLVRNLALGVAAVLVGSLVYATQDDQPWQVDWAVVSALVWAAVRSGAVLLGVAIDKARGVGQE